MYADCIVLFNKSELGMKLNFKNLETYCKKWRLNVSVTKSEMLIINGPKSKHFAFRIYDTKLEIVDSYTYLGLVISKTGDICLAIEELKKKASRPYFSIRQNNTSSNVIIKLFKP